MKRKNALYFKSDLQSVLDDLIKDLVYIKGKKLLRVVIPKEWKGRAAAFDSYIKKGNRIFEFKIDTFHPYLQSDLIYHTYEDGLIYFIFNPPVKKSPAEMKAGWF